MTYHNNHYNPDLKTIARELRKNSFSKAEKRIWKLLLSRKQMGMRFLRQRPIDRYIVDFFAPEIGLIIEIDGSSHLSSSYSDREKQNRLEELGYIIIRFTEGIVLNNLDEVSEVISHAIYCKQTKVDQ